jgi:membrane-associated phospholipid phosphatase
MIRRAGFTKAVPVTLALVVTLSGATAFAQDSSPSSQIVSPSAPAITNLGTFEPGSLVRLPSGSGEGSQLAADLFKPLARDFKGMLSQDNLLLAGIGGVSAAAGHNWDARSSAYAWGQDFGNVMRPGDFAGSFLVQTGSAVATYAIGRATGSRKVTSIGSSLFRAHVVAQTVTQGIKFSVRRTRPDGTVLSFPSGHTAAAFATASVLKAELGWKVGAPAYAAAAWVGASRMHARRHYLSDVIAGATIGIMAGRSVTVGSGRMKFAVSPAPVPRGVSVNFVKLGK